jgi:hypothetical protein
MWMSAKKPVIQACRLRWEVLGWKGRKRLGGRRRGRRQDGMVGRWVEKFVVSEGLDGVGMG